MCSCYVRAWIDPVQGAQRILLSFLVPSDGQSVFGVAAPEIRN